MFRRCLEQAERAARWALTGLIKGYQFAISPLFYGRCRFTPTCSVYAQESLKQHGLLTALALILGRLCRCHPFCKGGLDPVPELKKREE